MSSVSNLDAIEFLFSLEEDSSDLTYIDPPYFTGRDFKTVDGREAYSDKWNDADCYKAFIISLCAGARYCLKESGVLWIQCDWRMQADIFLIMREAFGESNFINSVVWPYRSGGGAKGKFSRKHDDLHIYGKNIHCFGNSKNAQLETLRMPYAPGTDTTKPGFHPEGAVMSDVWTDIGFMGTSNNERVGYPTQKSEELLERIIRASVHEEGSTIIDPTCGSGTTAAVAKKLGHIYHVNDQSKVAYEITMERLQAIG